MLIIFSLLKFSCNFTNEIFLCHLAAWSYDENFTWFTVKDVLLQYGLSWIKPLHMRSQLKNIREKNISPPPKGSVLPMSYVVPSVPIFSMWNKVNSCLTMSCSLETSLSQFLFKKFFYFPKLFVALRLPTTYITYSKSTFLHVFVRCKNANTLSYTKCKYSVIYKMLILRHFLGGFSFSMLLF